MVCGLNRSGFTNGIAHPLRRSRPPNPLFYGVFVMKTFYFGFILEWRSRYHRRERNKNDSVKRRWPTLSVWARQLT